MGRRLWLLASAVLAALVLSGTATAGGDAGLLAPVDRDLVDAAASVRERAVGVLSFGDVTGLGVGRADDGSPVVKAYVEKLPAVGVPASVAGVPVEVVLTGRASAQTEPQARASRPVPIGVSVGHPQVSAGTIGARVVDSAGVYLLSNNHVLADENEAAFGDPIVQPGPTDGGVVPDDTVAALSAFVPIDFSGGANAVDAAIATTSGTLLSTSSPLDDGFGSPGGPSVPASVGMSVQKYGRTSGRTTGTVDAVSVTVTVCYLADILGCLKDALFVDQIAIKGDAGLFSLPGDSGALVVTNDATRNPVGLLFAGAESAGDETTSYANPIDVVLSQFGVTLDPADDPPGPLPPPPPPEPPPEPPPPSPPPPPRAPEADPAALVPAGVEGGPALYLAVGARNVRGLRVRDEDVLVYDESGVALAFDGSDVGISRLAIDAIAVAPTKGLLLSFARAGVVPGLGRVEPQDVVRFVPSSLGPNTKGRFRWFLDGSDVDLTRRSENIDALDVLPGGRLLVSTRGAFSAGRQEGRDEDAIVLRQARFGKRSAGKWGIYFDGSDVGLGRRKSGDVDGIAVRSPTELLLTTAGEFDVGTATGGGEDAVQFTSASRGPATSGFYDPLLVLDGHAAGLGTNTVVGIALAPS